MSNLRWRGWGGGGATHYLLIFPENWLKMKEIGLRVGAHPMCFPQSANKMRPLTAIVCRLYYYGCLAKEAYILLTCLIFKLFILFNLRETIQDNINSIIEHVPNKEELFFKILEPPLNCKKEDCIGFWFWMFLLKLFHEHLGPPHQVFGSFNTMMRKAVTHWTR